MMRFIASKHNLKAMMNLLIDKSKNIQVRPFVGANTGLYM